MQTSMTLSKWYGRSVRIPKYGDYGYNGFVSSCLGLVASIVRRKMANEIHVSLRRLEGNSTAYADFTASRIVINEQCLIGEFGGVKADSSEQTIAVLMGIIVHEAAHFAWSPPTLTPGMDNIKENVKSPYDENVARSLTNIIEDVYIEAEVLRTVPSLHWTLITTNNLFFQETEQIERLGKVQEISEAPTEIEGIGSVINYLILAKQLELAPSGVSGYLTNLFNLVRTAADCETVSQRYALGVQVYDLLMEKIDESKCESGSDEGEGEGGLGELIKQLLQKLMEAGMLSATFMKDGEAGGRPVLVAGGVGTSYQAQEVEGKVEIMAKHELELVGNEFDGEVTPIMEIPLRFGETPIPVDERYNKLAEIGRQKAVVNRPYGMDRNRGHTIRKLHRIATDQKIFAEPMPVVLLKPMQVAFLVDWSGSMCMGGRYTDSDELDLESTNAYAASQAALGAALALSEARCDVAVYCHTDGRPVDHTVTIYRAKGFNESVATMALRLGSLDADLCYENRDGFAVQYVGRKLVDRSKRRILFVISDGAPSAPGYRGTEAVEHTKRVVDNLRKDGVEVISISITGSAKKINDTIYGEKNNVFNTDPNVVNDLIGKLIGG